MSENRNATSTLDERKPSTHLSASLRQTDRMKAAAMCNEPYETGRGEELREEGENGEEKEKEKDSRSLINTSCRPSQRRVP